MLPAGPITYVAPDEVRAIALELASIPCHQMAGRFSAQLLSEAGVYPDIWRDDPDALTSVLNDYDALIRFYSRAADVGNAVLLIMG
jgi:hypothetical protein